MNHEQLWHRFQALRVTVPELALTIDASRVDMPESWLEQLRPKLDAAIRQMAALERGAIANPDEKRMVGHYWLRAPQLAPNSSIADAIQGGLDQIRRFAAGVHQGTIKPPTADRFSKVLSIGIGGSALGPMLAADALGDPATDQMEVLFIDNTDPDGIARTLRHLKDKLPQTLCIVTSKSGGTPETRNGMLLIDQAYREAGLSFAAHAVAITMPDSQLDRQAREQKWMARFPMFDWVGGRTSELSAVGLLPAALQGLDIDGMLAGAAACDRATRQEDALANPAALLAALWYYACGGTGERDMVVLPYKDRLLLFSRYLQQLVMESLGKSLDLDGRRVEQGLAVYGNKGSTDQHAYVQQLREGVANFFVVFIRVLEAGGKAMEVEPGVTAGDYLHGFLLGTRAALYENGRQSITITIPRVDAQRLGGLIALFERTVGLYASLIHINAYHQPGVEAGKKAAAAVLELQRRISSLLSDHPQTAAQLASSLGQTSHTETVYLLLEHLVANGRARMAVAGPPGTATFTK
jgi:glucose-6-phosphate isomerase